MNEDFGEMLAALNAAGADHPLTSVTGLEFEKAWQTRLSIPLEGLDVPVLDLDSLIRNKLATGRPRDLADVDELRRRSGTTGVLPESP